MARVLIIEDDVEIAEMEREALQAEGHAVEVAQDGPTGVLSAQHFDPDVIVLDVSLPLFDGNAVLFGLQLNPSLCSIPVIVVSGQAGRLEDRSNERVARVLHKPFELRELADAVVELTGGVSA